MTDKTQSPQDTLSEALEAARKATEAFTITDGMDRMIKAYDAQLAVFVAMSEVGPITVQQVEVCAWWDHVWMKAWVPVEPFDFGGKVGCFGHDHVLIDQATYHLFRARQLNEWGDYASKTHPVVMGETIDSDLMTLFVLNDGFVTKPPKD
jgi:hypothetical protein